jgi:hypothetical protein
MIALLPWLDTAAARKRAGEFAVFFTPLFCNAYAGEKQTLCCLGSYTAMERALDESSRPPGTALLTL